MSRPSAGLSFRKKKLDGTRFQEVTKYVFGILAAILFAMFLTYNFGMKTSVIGNSMEPTLDNGQTIFYSRLSYLFRQPRVGDVIVFLPNGNKYTHYYVKRVVAAPGDTVLINNGEILVNGEAVNGEYDKIQDAGIAENEITLADDEFFVVGDNINSGEDSRSGNIGPVNKSLIEGRVWFKIKSGDNMTGFVKRSL